MTDLLGHSVISAVDWSNTTIERAGPDGESGLVSVETVFPTSSTVDLAPAEAAESTARKREASDIAAASPDFAARMRDPARCAQFCDALMKKLCASRGLLGGAGVGGALGVGAEPVGKVGESGGGVGHGAVSIGDDRGTLPATEGESDARDV